MLRWVSLFLVLVLLGVQRGRCASQACVDLLPDLLDACPAFEYAKENDLSLSVTESGPPVRRQDGATSASFMVQALDKIKAQNFDDTCCEFLSKVNTSRCFCEEDVVEALQSEMEEELLAFTLFTAARPLPGGCGGAIWASVDGEQCLPLGPMSDTGSVTSGCQSLAQVLRDPRNVRDSIRIFSEALDATDLIDTLEDMEVVTIFAPTDTAFVNFAESLGVSVSELLGNTKVLLPILEQHVIKDGLIKSADVAGSITVEGLNKNELLLDVTPSGGVTVEGTPITQTDIDICNGVLHVVSAVLVEFPSGEPKLVTTEDDSPVIVSGDSDSDTEDEDKEVVEAEDTASEVKDDEEEEDTEEQTSAETCDNTLFSLLISFEEAFGLLINEIEQDEGIKAILQGPGPVTIFAPINSELEVEKIINGEASLEDTAVTLRRLVVESDVKGQSLEPGTVLTTLGGEKIEASSSGGNIKINGVSVIQADIPACNGKLFIIESPLPPRGEKEDEIADTEEEDENVDTEDEEEKVVAEEETVDAEEEESTPTADSARETPENSEDDKDEVSTDKVPAESSEDADETDESSEVETPEATIESTKSPSSDPPASKPVPKETPPETTDTSSAKPTPIDNDPRRIVIKGAGEDSEEDEATEDSDSSANSVPASVEDSSEICGCSATGVSAGEETNRPGCGQHLLDLGETTIFCYIEEPDKCYELDDTVDMRPSVKFAPAYWKICEKEEIKSLPTLADLLGEQLDSLSPVWRIFVYAELDTILQEDGPFTVFVPSRLAVAGALAKSLMDGSSSDNRGLKKIMKRHIIKGEFSEEDLRSMDHVMTMDGEELSIYVDENGAALIGGAVSIEVADMFASNGVAHIVDDFIVDNLTTERTVSLEEACLCSMDGFSGRIQTGRPGCDTHIIGEAPFCYVRHPDECHLATDSMAFEGAKWMPCKDPCSCSKDGISGAVDTGRPGCARHIIGTAAFCYVSEPEQCKYASASEAFEGATWKWCESPSFFPIRAAESTVDEDDPCACAEDGISGGVYTGKRGCGRHGVLFALFNTCYVKDPSRCHKSFSSLRCNGAGWRFC